MQERKEKARWSGVKWNPEDGTEDGSGEGEPARDLDGTKSENQRTTWCADFRWEIDRREIGQPERGNRAWLD
jgi:hypothetical protein